MRRTILPVTALLLATACTSQAPVTPPPGDLPSMTADSAGKGNIGGATKPSGRLVVAIPAARLPYKPDAGIPPLDDVRVIKTAKDPCTLPADNSGEQVQLLGASSGGPDAVNVTFSFTNPCSTAVLLSYKVSAAIGSRTGEQAGGGAEGATAEIGPGRTVKQTISVDISTDLTDAQRERLWVGCTAVGKQAA